jgi:GNAT superfamily N-acetyltransferase
MPIVDVQLQCPIHDSFRVRQVAGMFDLPIAATAEERFTVELPELGDSWQIGAIVGPSGSGKTAVARAAFGTNLYNPGQWPAGRAVIDCFGDLPIKQITRALCSVGLGSPPAWVKPYAVLSNGEKFRCDLAAALLEGSGFRVRGSGRGRGRKTSGDIGTGTQVDGTIGHRDNRPTRSTSLNPEPRTLNPPPIVFDEFTSFVDRTVARIGSAAVARAIRGGQLNARFVAVTCHYDVIPWLAPDWVLDMADGKLTRRLLRRPDIELRVRRATRDEWRLFRRHHYLSGALHRSAQCFIGQIEGKPAAFTGVLQFPHPLRPGWREHRTVCLPDYQGLGIGHALSEFVASLYAAKGKPYFSATAHPAMIRHRAASLLWRMLRTPRLGRPIGTSGAGKTGMSDTCSTMRLTASFEYVGPVNRLEAQRLGIFVAHASSL